MLKSNNLLFFIVYYNFFFFRFFFIRKIDFYSEKKVLGKKINLIELSMCVFEKKNCGRYPCNISIKNYLVVLFLFFFFLISTLYKLHIFQLRVLNMYNFRGGRIAEQFCKINQNVCVCLCLCMCQLSRWLARIHLETV